MKKQPKQLLISVLLIIVFVILSLFNVYLIIKKNNTDMVLIYSIACFFFVFWLCGILFKTRFFRLVYKWGKKPMSKSMTMDILGSSVTNEMKAYNTFQKMIKTMPYVYLSTLIIGIIVLLLF